MKNRIIASAAAVLMTAGVYAQEITPVWVQHINGLVNVDPANKLPTLKRGGGVESNDGTSTTDCYGKMLRYDATRLLLMVRENGINEATASPAEKAIAEAYPDRSLIWIEAATGKPMGIAHVFGVRPVPTPGQGSNFDFYTEWGLDEGPAGQRVLYSGHKNALLRWAPKAGGGWESTPTVVWREPTPGALDEEGNALDESSNGDGSASWRWRDLRVTGSGVNTVITAGGGTWRQGQWPQVFKTTDGLHFKPTARVNNRDNGTTKHEYALGGLASHVVKYGLDPARPNLEIVYTGHYPGTGWNAVPNRYSNNPDAPVRTLEDSYAPDGVVSIFDRDEAAAGNLPAFTWEAPGHGDPIDHAVDGVTRYDGNWNCTLDADSSLDYIVAYSMPSWNNQFGSIKKPGWLGIHTLNGKIASGNSSYKLDFVETDEPEAANGDQVGTDWGYDGDVTLYPDKTAPKSLGKSEVMWVGSAYGFGVFTVQNVAAVVVSSPASKQVSVATPLVLTAEVKGSPNTYQWYKDNAPIDGATKPTYKVDLATLADSGKYQLKVTNPAGNAQTTEAVIQVIVTDSVPPSVVSASTLDKVNIGICFSELVDAASAVNVANYNFGAIHVVSATVMSDGKSVALTLDGPVGANFNFTVSGVKDLSGNAIAANTSVSGSAQGYTAEDIGSPNTAGSTFTCAPGEYTIQAGGSDIWGASDQFHYMYKQAPGDFDMAVQVVSIKNPNGWGRNGIMLRESTDAGSRHINMTASSIGANVWDMHIRTDTDGQTGRTTGEVGKAPSLHPNVWVRLRRVGDLVIGYRGTNGTDWTEHGRAIFPSATLVGIATSLGGGQSVPAETHYENFGDFSYPSPSITINTQPQAATGLQSRTVTFSVDATAFTEAKALPAGELTYQWKRNGQAIDGATSATFTTGLLTLADNNSDYQVVVSMNGATKPSVIVKLTVLADTVPPVLVSSAAFNSENIGLCFDELMDPATAGDAAKYKVTGGTVNSATLRADGKSVALSVSGLTAANYSVTVNGVKDLAGNPVTKTSTGSVDSFTAVDVGSPATAGSSFSCVPGEYTIEAGGSDIWGASDQFHYLYETVPGNFDVAVQVLDIKNPNGWGRNGIMLRESTDAGSRHINMTASSIGANVWDMHIRTDTDGQTGRTTGEVGKAPSLHPNVWVRLRRVGDTVIGYRGTTGTTWTEHGRAVFPNAILVGLATSLGGGQAEPAVTHYANFGNFAYPNASIVVSSQPAAVSVAENLDATFTVAAKGFTGATELPAGEVFYQWQKNQQDIPGANSAKLTLKKVSLADKGSTYRVVILVPGATLRSAEVSLDVFLDTEAPKVVSASGLIGYVGVLFDGLMDPASAGNVANYSVNGKAVQSATLQPNGLGVNLAVDGLGAGPFTVTINNVKDLSGNTIAANTKASGVVAPFATEDIGGPSIVGSAFSSASGQFSLVGGGNGVIAASDQMRFVSQSVSGDFDKKVKITGITAASSDTWARGGIMARESSDPKSHALKLAASNPNGANQVAVWVRADDVSNYGDAGRRYGGVSDALPNQWLRMQRVGNNFLFYVGQDGQKWSLIAEKYVPVLAASLEVGVYAAAQTEGDAVTVDFSDYGDVVHNDTVRPALVSAGTLDKKTIGVKFSEAISSASVTTANFAVTQAVGGAVTVTAAQSGLNENTVHLTVSGLTSDSFTVIANHVKDLSGNEVAAGSSASASASAWKSEDIGAFGDPANRPAEGDDPYVIGQSVPVSSGDNIEVEIIGGGSNIWNPGDFGQFIYKEVSGDFDVMVEVNRFDRSIGTGSYGHAGLEVRDSLYLPGGEYTAAGTKVRNVMYTTYAEANQERTSIGIWRDAEGGGYGNSGPIGTGTLINGIQGRFGKLIAANAKGDQLPNTSPDAGRWLRMQRVGDQFNFFYSYDGETWVADGSHTLKLNSSVALGFLEMTDTSGKNPAHYNVLNLRNFGNFNVGAPAPQFTKIKANTDGTVTVEWTGGGTLQYAGAVTGPWVDAAAATSPYTFTPPASVVFARIKR